MGVRVLMNTWRKYGFSTLFVKSICAVTVSRTRRRLYIILLKAGGHQLGNIRVGMGWIGACESVESEPDMHQRVHQWSLTVRLTCTNVCTNFNLHACTHAIIPRPAIKPWPPSKTLDHKNYYGCITPAKCPPFQVVTLWGEGGRVCGMCQRGVRGRSL